MDTETMHSENGDLAERALEIYSSRLREQLEPEHNGEAVAIHVDSGDFALGRGHMEAMRHLRSRHARDGRIVILTVGPPTDSDRQLIGRTSSSAKA